MGDVVKPFECSLKAIGVVVFAMIICGALPLSAAGVSPSKSPIDPVTSNVSTLFVIGLKLLSIV